MLMRLFKKSMILPLMLMAFLAAVNLQGQDTTKFRGDIWFENGYYGEAYVNQEFTFDFNAYTKYDSEINYSIIDAPDGAAIDEVTGVLTWTPDQEGDAYLVVRAYLVDDATKYEDHPFMIYVTDANKIYFTSLPYDYAWVGHEYKFDITAKSGTGNEINYELTQAPDGMTIDKETGTLVWTPSESGNFECTVKAYFANDPSNFSAAGFMMIAMDSSAITPCATISGKVTWEGEVKSDMQSYVTVIPKDFNSKIIGAYFAEVAPDGSYSLEVPKGDYYAYAEGLYGYIYQWFDNAESMEGATVINAECNQTYTANFNFHVSDTMNIVFFQSYPYENVVHVGENYYYDAEAVALMGGDIRYKLDKAPDGMTVDATTGEVKWTPTATGEYNYDLVAYVDGNESQSAVQTNYIMVLKERAPACADIKGQVLDKEGNPVAGAYITAFSNDSLDKMYYEYYTATTDNSGNYSIHLAEGQYLLFAQGNFMPVFWENAYSPDEAKMIDIKCNDTFTANFTVESIPVPSVFNISGKVTSEDGTPVYSVVEFIPDPSDFRDSLEFNANIQFAYTDPDGSYYMMLPDMYKYKAVAIPLEGNYMSEYWDNKDNYNDATVIEVKDNMTDINFTLPMHQNYNNSLHGIVRDSAGNGIDAQVMAFTVPDWNAPWDIKAVSVMTDKSTTGQFNMSNLIPGDYILFAMPMAFDFAPGYYKQGDFATFNWEEATVVNISENENIPTNHEIILADFTYLKGIVRLEGDVITYKGKTKKGDDHPQSSETVSGVYISVVDKSGKQVAWTLSDDKGHYSFDNIAAGSFSVVASKEGYEKYEKDQNFNLSDRSNVKDNIVLVRKGVTSVEDDVITTSGISAYPNPAANVTNIRFSATSGAGQLTVTDMLGNDILTNSVNLTEGQNNVSIETANLPSGSYIVTIKNGKTSHRTLVQVIH